MFAVEDWDKQDRSASKLYMCCGHPWVETELKDVGDQTLMRGSVAAFPIERPGCSCLTAGVGGSPGHKASDGIPLPWSRLRGNSSSCGCDTQSGWGLEETPRRCGAPGRNCSVTIATVRSRPDEAVPPSVLVFDVGVDGSVEAWVELEAEVVTALIGLLGPGRTNVDYAWLGIVRSR